MLNFLKGLIFNMMKNIYDREIVKEKIYSDAEGIEYF